MSLFPVGNPNGCPVQFNDISGHGQSQSRSGTDRFCGEERLEKFVEFIVGYAGAGILNLHHDPFASGLGARLLAGSYYGQTVQIWAALFAAAALSAVLVGIVGLVGRIAEHRMGFVR